MAVLLRGGDLEVSMMLESTNSLLPLDRLQQLDLVIDSLHCRVLVEWFRAINDPAEVNRHWHAHSNMELHCMIQGTMHYDLKDQQISLSSGQALLIPANMPHRLELTDSTNLLRFTLNVSVEPVNEDPEGVFLQKALDVSKASWFPMDDAMIALLETCLYEAVRRVSGFMTVIESNLLSLLMLIARTLSHSPQAAYRVREKQSMNKRRRQQILELMEQAATESLTVSDIARYMHLSSKQVQRIVQAEYGTSVKQLMMRIRLQRAKELLKDPSQSMATIAAALSFTSEQSFCRFFQKLEGRSPGRYRNDMMPQ